MIGFLRFYLCFVGMVSAALTLLLVASTAMLNGGEITLYFNRWHEGWFEVAFLILTVVFVPSFFFKVTLDAHKPVAHD